MTNINDFLNWARQVQSSKHNDASEINADVISGQGLNTPTPSIEDAIRSVTNEPTTPLEPTVEESVEQLDEALVTTLALAKAQLKKSGGRQLKNPKTEVLVVDKKGKVIVIDKKDQKKYIAKGWGLAESVEPLDEALVTSTGKTRTFEFSDNRKAKQFAKDISNSAVATGTVSGNRVIDVEVLKGSPSVAKSAIAKYLKQNRGKEISESVEVDEKHKVGHKGTCKEVHPDETHEDWEKVQNDPRIQEAKKPDFTVTAMKGSKTLESMPADKKELKDAIKFMKTHFRGAKIIVKDSKGKTKGVYESNNIKKEYLDLDNRTNKILKKLLDIS